MCVPLPSKAINITYICDKRWFEQVLMTILCQNDHQNRTAPHSQHKHSLSSASSPSLMQTHFFGDRKLPNKHRHKENDLCLRKIAKKKKSSTWIAPAGKYIVVSL